MKCLYCVGFLLISYTNGFLIVLSLVLNVRVERSQVALDVVVVVFSVFSVIYVQGGEVSRYRVWFYFGLRGRIGWFSQKVRVIIASSRGRKVRSVIYLGGFLFFLLYVCFQSQFRFRESGCLGRVFSQGFYEYVFLVFLVLQKELSRVVYKQI